ncbi:MAG: hypothetical protein RL211_2283, partial [Pseudomonadota bacterium]
GDAGDQHRVEVGSGGVHSGAVAGWAGAQDQDFGLLDDGHGFD